jgi:hypothetical protein
MIIFNPDIFSPEGILVKSIEVVALYLVAMYRCETEVFVGKIDLVAVHI